MSRPLRILLLSTSLAVPGLALAEELTPEQIARIRRDEQAAIEQVNAAHGHKKSSELSSEERLQMITHNGLRRSTPLILLVALQNDRENREIGRQVRTQIRAPFGMALQD